MSPYEKKLRKSKRNKIFRKWHRRVGFATSLFLFNLAVTGIILNHYESLGLHKSFVQSQWVLDWYDIKAPEDIACTESSNQKICQLDSLILLIDETQQVKLLLKDKGKLVNSIQQDNQTYVITSRILYIYDLQFQLIDSINIYEEMATNIKNAQLIDNKLFISTIKGIWQFDSELFEFVKVEVTEESLIDGLQFTSVKEKEKEKLSGAYREQQITLLKLVQDLHSGQILSNQGKLLIDLTGIIIMFLGISGFSVWHRRRF